MITKKSKKLMSSLAVGLLLSGTIFSSVSAKGNTAAVPNSTQNSDIYKIGGGPSPSAAWTKDSSWYRNFSRDQLSELNYLYNDVINSSDYNRAKNLYSASTVLAGLVGGVAGSLTISGSTTFCDNYFSLVQNSANTVNQAYYQCSTYGTKALYVTKYYRPATGEIMFCLSWY
ncbi:hypothetical protein [Clostridium sp. JS66]|uniref:hypothetical protein n=1 Tax=Clostridium sp. JS66 TaxID=3064705 RepID=UPI00298E178E|nr:hypothetical protein [Clostridium sp. JS66]WPC39660.1 hypothetical protein Q6H37_17265 [Clostridium sp. JS66]